MQNRRNFLKNGISVAGFTLLTGPFNKALAVSCGITPPQTSGPFYPGEAQFHFDNDLTQMPGRPVAKGAIVYVQGKVQDNACRAIPNANVEIWQACASGRYNNSKDPNTAALLDPNFKYWGETTTDLQGRYFFKTIIPGAYPADTNWTRPPHIHFKVSCLGYHELVTQMYFAGNAYNDKDLILQDIPSAERGNVIVPFKAVPSDPNIKVGVFDITMRSVRS